MLGKQSGCLSVTSGLHQKSNVSKICLTVLNFGKFWTSQIQVGHCTNRTKSVWTAVTIYQ